MRDYSKVVAKTKGSALNLESLKHCPILQKGLHQISMNEFVFYVQEGHLPSLTPQAFLSVL